MASFEVTSYRQLKEDPRYIEIKQTMDSGQWHADCAECRAIEESTVDDKQLSKRQMCAPYYDTVGELGSRDLTILFFDTGKLCNLACRSCSPELSSSWIKEWNMIHPETQYRSIPVKKTLELDNQSFRDLRVLELLGGEPLYNLDSYGVMQRVIEETNNQCVIYIATNGMIFPDLDKYPWFRNNTNIQFILSIDAVGPAAEFIRTGSDWAKIRDNVDKYRAIGSRLGYHVTHSVLNLFELDRINDWRIAHGFIESKLLTVVNYPGYLSFAVLTQREKDDVCRYLSERYGKYLVPVIEKSEFNPELREQFLKFMIHTKNYHGLDWQTCLPELYQLMSSTTVDFSQKKQ